MENSLLEARLNRSRYGNVWNYGKAPSSIPEDDPDELNMIKYLSPSKYLSYLAGDLAGVIENNGEITFTYGKNIAISLTGNMVQQRIDTGYPPVYELYLGDYNDYIWNDVFASSPLVGVQSQKISVSSRVVVDECSLLDNIGKLAGGNINKNFPADIAIPPATARNIVELPCPVQPVKVCAPETRFMRVIDIYIPPQDHNPTNENDYCNYGYQMEVIPYSARIQIVLPDGTYPDNIILEGDDWNQNGNNFVENVNVIIQYPGLTGGLWIITTPDHETVSWQNNPGVTLSDFMLNTVFPYITSKGVTATQFSSPYCQWYLILEGRMTACDITFSPPAV